MSPETSSDKTKYHAFLLKIIFETTILLRNFASRGECQDDYLFRIIHVARAAGNSEKGFDEFVKILRSYVGDDLQKKIIEFVLTRAGITKYLPQP